MAEDRWQTVAVPLLEQIAEDEGAGTVKVVADLGQAIGVAPKLVAIEIDRLLDGGFIRGNFNRPMAPPENWFLIGAQLSERGARVVGAWPSTDPLDGLVQALTLAIDAHSDPEEKSRLERARDAVVGLGRHVGEEVLTAYIRAHLGV